ncbi:MAG TPA: formylglycine-generating enzyme family protein [Steroidobacteraceae bacterium]|nr:formylglycine-generating enzyme family protein [Steroidobacteraceae bacterium]
MRESTAVDDEAGRLTRRELLQSAAGVLATMSIGPSAAMARDSALAWIPPGVFTMGSPASEPLREADEGPQTVVTLTRGFWLGRNLVTIGGWKSVMGFGVRDQLRRVIADDTLYEFKGKKQTLRSFMQFSRAVDPGEYLANEDDNLPMYYVSWLDAIEFCRRLTERDRAAARLPEGHHYGLPTEAQWEYAARAGTASATYEGPLASANESSSVLDSIAWYDANSADGYTGKGFAVRSRTGGPRAVGGKKPNRWGLNDTAGNLWEWCSDWYGSYPGGHLVDPKGPATGLERVNRGGSFGSSAGDERSANRAANPPAEASAYRGFRLALVRG